MEKVGWVALALTIGGLIGIWHGRATEADRFRKLLLYADLPPACEQMLRDTADAENDAADSMRQADEPFTP